jgi:uncharacterized protein
MSNLKSKLNLYSGKKTDKTADKLPESLGSKTSAGSSDIITKDDSVICITANHPLSEVEDNITIPSNFPDKLLSGMAAGNSVLNTGFNIIDLVLPDPKYGEFRLSDFWPLNLSGILELSYITYKEAIHPEEILFFDTETTGLSRGAGTIPFLLGFSYIKGRSVHIRQYFLTNISKESAMLDSAVEFMNLFPYLVTFNGKSFDMPLLRNRLILNRRRAREPLLHFDLLHIYRKLLPRDHWKGHSQSAMEQAVLNHFRENDISGDKVPQIYFDHVKYGISDQISEVMKHNELDVTGLAFLFLKAIEIYTNKSASTQALRGGIARILAKNKRFNEIPDIFNEAEAQEQMNYKDKLLLAMSFKKMRNYLQAESIYRQILTEYQCPFALLLLLKTLEHQMNKYSEALELLLKHEDTLKKHQSPEKIMSRRKRLERKIGSV